MNPPETSTLKPTDVIINLSQASLPDLTVPEEDIDDDQGSIIAPVGRVRLPADYRPPSDYGDFDNQRRLDIFQQASGHNNVFNADDFYAEEMGKLMVEAELMAQSNARWATTFKYVNKIVIFAAIIINAAVAIVTIEDRNYAAGVLAAIVAALLTIHEMFGLGIVGIEYFQQGRLAMSIKNDLLDVLADDDPTTQELKRATRKARKDLDNLNYQVFESSYGPRSAARAVQKSTPQNQNQTDFSEFLNQESEKDASR